MSHATAQLAAKTNQLRNLLEATFYLFGLLWFISLPNAFTIFGETKGPGYNIIFQQLSRQFAIAANALVIFLIAHCVQWFGSSRVQAFTQRITTSESE